MKLIDCEVGYEYIIIQNPTFNKKLISLGFVINRKIRILHKTNKNLVVCVLGVVYVLEADSASKIMVIKGEVWNG